MKTQWIRAMLLAISVGALSGAPLFAQSETAPLPDAGQNEYAASTVPSEKAGTEATRPVAAGAGAACACDGCQSECVFTGCCDPTWAVRADALALQRSGLQQRVLLITRAANNAALLDAQDLNFNTAAGFQLGFTRFNVLDTGWDLEALYFNVDGFSANSGIINSPDGIDVNFQTPVGFPGQVTAGLTYTSDLQNLELNARRQALCNLTFLAGFRWVELDENLAVTLLNAEVAEGGVSTTNTLLGFQIGAEARLWSNSRWEIDGALKAGIYNDHASVAATYYETGGCGVVHNNTAFVGEIDLTAVYHINGAWSFRAGYELLWLDGVALATNQIATCDPVTGTATLNQGTVFYQGATLGLEYRH
jgi:hypothetical protein